MSTIVLSTNGAVMAAEPTEMHKTLHSPVGRPQFTE